MYVFLLCVMFICTLSSGFCATALDEEDVSTYFCPHLRGGVLVVFRIWRSTSSHGLLLRQYLYVSRSSGLPCNCMTGILINFHFGARCSVVKICPIARFLRPT